MSHTLTPTERVEFEALMADALEREKRTGDRTDLVLDMLFDARQAGRSWAQRVLDDYTRDGCAKDVRRAAKAGQTETLRLKRGGTRQVPAVVGIIRDGEWEQVPLPTLSRPELSSHAAMIRAQIAGLGAHEAAMRRLLAAFDRHPECATVGEALAADGSSVADALGVAA